MSKRPDGHDVLEQIDHVEHLLPALPDQGAGLYLLSTARQSLGQTGEALKLLRQCVALHEGFDPAGSPSLKVLKGSKEFDLLVLQVHREFPAVRTARLAFVTRETAVVPEGLAYDARQDVFYLSSLNRRKIIRITPAGVMTDFVPEGRDDLLPILGIRVDPGDGTVWAASWAEASSKSELLHFDSSGKLLSRYAPQDSFAHGFNDLVVRKNGDVMLTDSLENQLLRLERGSGKFAVVLVHRGLSAPNGVAISDDDSQLFVADDFGIVRVDLQSGESIDVDRGIRNTLAGVDGLYWNKGRLIAIQNAIGSPRVVAFLLTKEGARVQKTTVLENRSDFVEQPSTGAIRGDHFYFMANTQGDRMREDHFVEGARAQPVRIATLKIPW